MRRRLPPSLSCVAPSSSSPPTMWGGGLLGLGPGATQADALAPLHAATGTTRTLCDRWRPTRRSSRRTRSKRSRSSCSSRARSCTTSCRNTPRSGPRSCSTRSACPCAALSSSTSGGTRCVPLSPPPPPPPPPPSLTSSARLLTPAALAETGPPRQGLDQGLVMVIPSRQDQQGGARGDVRSPRGASGPSRSPRSPHGSLCTPCR